MGHARRLIRELPKDSEELRRRSRTYADPTFLSLFFEWLDHLLYHDPQTGLEWAKVAPDLALAVVEKAEAEGHSSKHQELLVRAWIILGGAFRACSDHDAAEETHGKAQKLIQSKTISVLVSADADRRLSFLRACQGQANQALELASGAVDRLRRADAPRQLGDALIARGYVLANEFHRFREAVDAFGEALDLAGNGKGSPAVERLHATACLNLAMAVLDGSLADLKTALLYIRQAKAYLKGQKRSAARYRLLWVEALIWNRTGSHAKAERLFRQALEGFEALQLPWEIALVGLDLAALLHLCGELEKLQQVATLTYRRFRVLSGADTRSLAVLSLWVDAVERRSWRIQEMLGEDEKARGARQRKALHEYDELHQGARQMVLAGVFAGQCYKRRRAAS